MIPRELLGHTVTVEPHLGQNASGPVYGAPIELPAFVDRHRRQVRGSDGVQLVSGTTVYFEHGAPVGELDRVTTSAGELLRVIEVRDRDGGGLPTPDHIEIVCE